MNSHHPIVTLKKSLVLPGGRKLPPREWDIDSYRGEQDVEGWLDVQNAAFAAYRTARPWTIVEFRRELLSRSWWSPARLWLVRPAQPDGGPSQVVATIALQLTVQTELTGQTAQIHWLAVHPAAQRRGLGRSLVSIAESECLQHDVKSIAAETLRGSPAEAFYRQCGFDG